MRNPARSFKMGLSRDYVGTVSNQVESVVCRLSVHSPTFVHHSIVSVFRVPCIHPSSSFRLYCEQH
jgi:hypothetical protein